MSKTVSGNGERNLCFDGSNAVIILSQVHVPNHRPLLPYILWILFEGCCCCYSNKQEPAQAAKIAVPIKSSSRDQN